MYASPVLGRRTKTGGKIRISYPCVMLNADVHQNYTNHQVRITCVFCFLKRNLAPPTGV